MFELLKRHVLPIGVDLGSGYLRMVQMHSNSDGLSIRAAGFEQKPADIETGSPVWQRWAVQSCREIFNRAGFKGRQVITALPSDDVFIDQIKLPRGSGQKLEELVLNKVKQKLSFGIEQAAVKYVVAESRNGCPEDDVVVMVAEREKVSRHLAIFEKAGLEIKSIAVWPFAMINSYVSFFARRQCEQESIAMLMEIGTNHTNIVICRHRNLLFARVIAIGQSHIARGEMIPRLIAEIDACCRYFESVSNGGRIERLMFLSCRNIDKGLCQHIAALAQKMQVPAQIGDVVGAMEKGSNRAPNFDRRDSTINWSSSIGLSLAGMA